MAKANAGTNHFHGQEKTEMLLSTASRILFLALA